VGTPSASLDRIQGAITLIGNGGNDVLTLDDSAAATAHNYSLSVDEFTRADSPAGAVAPPVTFSNFKTITLNAGAGGNAIEVDSTAAGTSVVINGGPGPDLEGIFLVADQNALLGSIAIHIQPGAFELVEYVDSNNPNPQTYTVTDHTISRSGQADVTYDGAFVGAFALEIFEPAVGGNSTYVRSVAAGSEVRTFDSNGDQVIVGSQAPNTGGDLNGIQGFVGVAASDPKAQVSLLVDDSGNLDTTPKHAVFTSVRDADGFINLLGCSPGSSAIGWNLPLTSSVTILGGAANTTFEMQPIVGETPVTIIGGPGSNTLDYSAYTTSVTVSLVTGTATDLAGIRDPQTERITIQNIIGGSGDDTLSAGGDRSILIGGGGADQLFGGDGEAILIGGTTDYTQPSVNAAALDAIIQEWSRTDLGFNDRMSDLLFGNNNLDLAPKNVVDGALIPLDNTTVHDDLAANVLTGGIGLDWFFAGANDAINNQKPGDAVTLV
jgi:hypothetical protein